MKKGIIEVLQTEMLDFTAPVIVNNIPTIDGLLCSQRQVIWGMFKAKMTSDKQFYKMLKASGRIFDYYVLGDMPLCGVMKNMGNNYVLNKYLMPKGSFGNKNLRDGTGSAPRYIECKLDKYSEYMLEGINKSAVQMKKNYDATEYEPIILPSKIPNILTNLRMSIAVSEANRMPSHNIIDVCNSIQSYIENEDIENAINLIKVPDLPSGGMIIYDKATFDKIYKTGKGSFINVGKYKYDKDTNTVTIYEIPYSTYIENIEDEIEKNLNKFSKELNDYHNGSDKDGPKLQLYLKKNTNVERFIAKLRKYTSFESKFSCNFTILDLDGKTPKLMSLEDIIQTWVQHRINCIKNETLFDINKNKEELNKLYGLKIINENLDKAIQIIRSSKTEKIAIEELISYFKLNQQQAEYISTVKLVNINQEWIERKIDNIKELEQKNIELDTYYNSQKSIKNTIIYQLEDVKKKFGKPRKTEIIYEDKLEDISKEDLIEDYNCKIIYTEENYIKKLNKSVPFTQHNLKDNDRIIEEISSTNLSTLLFLTNKANRYQLNCYDLETTLPSKIGEYTPNLFDLEPGEDIIKIISVNKESKGYIVCVYENGNVSKVPIKQFLNNHTKLMNCYNIESKLIDIKYIEKDTDILLISKEGKGLIIDTTKINAVNTKNSKGVVGINLKSKLEDNVIVGSVIDIKLEDSITVKTKKGKEKYMLLNDVAPTNQENETRTTYKYLKGNRNTQGNFTINTRLTKDEVVEVIINK